MLLLYFVKTNEWLLLLFCVLCLLLFIRWHRDFNFRWYLKKILQGHQTFDDLLGESLYLPFFHKELVRLFKKRDELSKEKLDLISMELKNMEHVFNSMVDGVVVLDQDNCVTYINPSARFLMGVKGIDVSKKPFEEVIVFSALIDIVLKADRDSSLVQEEVSVFHAGRETVLWVFFQAIRHGEHQSKMMVLRDITQKRYLESIRSDFVANASHELKTPLTVMQGYVDVLDQEPLSSVEAKHAVSKIKQQVTHLIEMVQDLLMLSKSNALDNRDDFVKVDLANVLESCLQNHKDLAKQHEVEVITSVQNVYAFGTVQAFESVFSNLIDNAIKYSSKGQKIWVSLSKRGDQVLYSVQDEGMGIPSDDLHRIFERFYRVDKSRASKGTGLGLSIVKNVSKHLGGQVIVESRLHEGSKFEVYFPLA